MVVKTASIREIDKLSKTSYKVLIMRRYPFWMKGLKKKINEYLPILSPSEQLLTDYLKELKRVNNPKIAWNLVQYDSRFRRQILRDSNALAEMRRIKRISKELNGKRVVYLLCHEPTDEYCHRRIIKELMDKFDLGD